MKRRNFFSIFRTVLVYAAILLAASASEGVDMQEGEWEYTSEVVMEGMPFAIPPTKTRQCLTKKDIVPEPESEKDKDCIVKDQQISGNTVKWTVICKDKDGTSEGKGVITYSGSSYKGTMKMTMTDKKGSTEQMTIKMSGKHLGPCTKETIAAKKEMEKQLTEGKNKSEQALKQFEEDKAKRKKEAEAIIARVKVPDEDKNACVFDTESQEKNKGCESSVGILNIKDGWWEVKKELATVSGSEGQKFYSSGQQENKGIILTQERPFDMHIGDGCGGEKIVVKRSGNKLTWRHKCDYPGGGKYTTTKELKGGITFSGESYDGGIIEKLYSNGKEQSTTYTKLTGNYLRGRAYTAQKRAYTSSDRQETISDKTKDAVGNPVKSIKKLFGW
ncbi:MAG: DUF3617 family protein [Nitrospirae bacterium]|nr:DUF3617 family protein [Nitrospirota bacterium]